VWGAFVGDFFTKWVIFVEQIIENKWVILPLLVVYLTNISLIFYNYEK